MDNLKRDYKLDKSTWRALTMSTGNSTTWAPVEEYFEYRLQLLLERLEHCDVRNYLTSKVRYLLSELF